VYDSKIGFFRRKEDTLHSYLISETFELLGSDDDCGQELERTFGEAIFGIVKHLRSFTTLNNFEQQGLAFSTSVDGTTNGVGAR
jgi:hypothetical protein